MGTSNQNASFGTAIEGALGSAASNGFVYNFTTLDYVATGLAASGVRLSPHACSVLLRLSRSIGRGWQPGFALACRASIEASKTGRVTFVSCCTNSPKMVMQQWSDGEWPLLVAQVTPYWAVTYAPTPLQPANISNEATQLAQCLGFQDVPGKYQCRPQVGASNSAAGFDDCWKCPPKVAFRLQMPCNASHRL